MQLNSPKDTFNLSKKIGKILSKGDIIFLYGEIGVGKTTFVRGLINNFQAQRGMKETEVLSPTFNIVFEYEMNEFIIKHFDLYRLKKAEDIKNIGLFENSENEITLIEWPELIYQKPLNRVDMFFRYEKNYRERSLSIKTSGRLKIHEF